MPEEKKSNKPLIIGAIVLVLAVASYGTFKYTNKYESKQEMVNTPFMPPELSNLVDANVPINPTVITMYKDGTYASEGKYESPAGQEKIAVKIMLKGDLIVDADVISLAINPTSKIMQGKFISGFKTLVVGKKLSEVNLTKVSGSSLTPKGWNDAVSKIQTQAKV